MRRESELSFYGNLGVITITIVACAIFVIVVKFFF